MNMKPMCQTSAPKWGYKITHPTTKARVSVGPFIDRKHAEKRMEEAYGNRKVLAELKTFDFTPTWNGWEQDEYKGEDVVEYYALPIIN